MSNFYVMEAVNLFCGDADPTASKHLTLQEMKLPDLTETFADHTPGGGVLGMQIGMNIVEALEPTFKLAGKDPQLLSQFGLGSPHRHIYTGYGAIRNKRSGAAIEVKAIMEGRLASIQGDAFQRGELMGHEYAIKEMMRYELWFDGSEKIALDFWTNTKRIDGVDQNADVNRILRIG